LIPARLFGQETKMIHRRRNIMNLTRRERCRRGATLVEVAIVLPVTFFLIFALVVGVVGVFSYQEVASLTRTAGRYASTHGAQYRKDAGLAIGTATDWQTDINTNAVQPAVIMLDPKLLTMQATWPDVINQAGVPDNWPTSTVTVTITYQWFPQLYLVGPYHMTSSSCMVITN
jgi:Flp pilus assembly protein TadG